MDLEGRVHRDNAPTRLARRFGLQHEEQFPYANVALAVVALRARHELTQRDLAERVGTAQPVIARLESGRHPVEIKLLARIAAAVGETWTVTFLASDADADPSEVAVAAAEPSRR